MGLETAIAGALLGGVNIYAGRKAEKKQEKARQIEMNRQDVAANQQRRQMIRQQRIRRARIEAAAVASGVSGSSSESGAIAASETITGSNIANSRTQQESVRAQSDLLQKAQNIQSNTNLANSIFNLGANLYNVWSEDGGEQ